MAKRSEVEGLKELEKYIKRVGKLPQKCVTKSARRGATVALKAARQNAPEDAGNLKQGLVLKGERARVKGKKVYQVTLDRRMNHHFQKEIEEPGKYGGKNPYAYYPASQEYGYLTANGYVPGFRYLKRSLTENKSTIEKKTVEVLSKEIDKIK